MLYERILILDGDMGTEIQLHKLKETDFRGECFKHEIPLEPSSKFRVCRSLVKSDYDGIDWTHA